MFIVNVGGEAQLMVGAERVFLEGHHDIAVEAHGGAEAQGVGSRHVGVALGIAEAVDVGVEAVLARDAVHAVADVHPGVAEFGVAVDEVEDGVREEDAIEEHVADVVGLDDDVDVVRQDVDVGVVEGGKGHVADALLDRGYPHHGGVALGVVVAGLVEVDGAGLRGLEVAGALALGHGEVAGPAGHQRVQCHAVFGDDVAIGARGDLDEVAHAVLGGGHDEVPAPGAQGHGLLEHMVVAVADISWDAGEGVAVEDGDALAVAGADASPAEVDGVAGDPVRPELVGLAGVHCDGEGLVGGMSPQGVHGGGDVDVRVVFGGHDDKGRGLVVPNVGIVAGTRLFAALDDVFVAEAFDRQHAGGVEGHVGDVGAVDRDGVAGGHLDAFFVDAFVLGVVVVALFLRDFNGGDAVGADGEALRPARQGVRDGARAVAFGADEHLVDDPSSGGVVLEPVVHEREPELPALGRGVLRKQWRRGGKAGEAEGQQDSNRFHVITPSPPCPNRSYHLP